MFGEKSFSFIQQNDYSDCGLACIAMIAKSFGRTISMRALKERIEVPREGLSLHNMSNVYKSLGLNSVTISVSVDKLCREIPLPAIALVNNDHYVVIYKIHNGKVYFADPAIGKLNETIETFSKRLVGQTIQLGDAILLLSEPTEEFYIKDFDAKRVNKGNFWYVIQYFFKYKFFLILLILSLLIGSALELVLPFFLQSIVDLGIIPGDLRLIYILVLAQFAFYISIATVSFIRAHILSHLNSRVNIYIVSDFIMKLIKLPLKFFDSKTQGDLIQRIRDQSKIKSFLTETLLVSFSSLLSLVILSSVLALYDIQIFFVFAAFTLAELVWIFIYLKKIRPVYNEGFMWRSKDQGKTYELISGIAEVKLYDADQQQQEEWGKIQEEIFKIDLKMLKLNQKQDGGARFFNYSMIATINLMVAFLVIQGQLTLGAMMAIISILGQLIAPVSNIINLILNGQSAKISLERMAEIYSKEDESEQKERINTLGNDKNIYFRDVSFQFNLNSDQPILKNINVDIPAGKVTAIVGMSGSGKTTLTKLLMKFYEPTGGDIFVGHIPYSNLQDAFWRTKCGTVLQDGFIFSNTIARNISMGYEIDNERLNDAVRIANISEFIESLPKGFQTKIGADGNGLSQGQRQRILLARAIYKDPEYLFLDEATNALDAKNERIIVQNLKTYFQGRTVVLVAHRLSTIKGADKIILVENGEIKESGQHESLLATKGKYYELVRNQLHTEGNKYVIDTN